MLNLSAAPYIASSVATAMVTAATSGVTLPKSIMSTSAASLALPSSYTYMPSSASVPVVHFPHMPSGTTTATSVAANAANSTGASCSASGCTPPPLGITSSMTMTPSSSLHPFHTPSPHVLHPIPSSSHVHNPITMGSTCSSNSTTTSASIPPPPLLQEEITTIFVVGFPPDMHEREFQNMFIFSPGFEAATLKIPAKDEIDHAGHKKQIIGFAKFRTRLQALEARDILSGRKVDAEKGSVLKAEMAKKNLHTKRGLSNEFFHPAFQQYGILNMQLSAAAAAAAAAAATGSPSAGSLTNNTNSTSHRLIPPMGIPSTAYIHTSSSTVPVVCRTSSTSSAGDDSFSNSNTSLTMIPTQSSGSATTTSSILSHPQSTMLTSMTPSQLIQHHNHHSLHPHSTTIPAFTGATTGTGAPSILLYAAGAHAATVTHPPALEHLFAPSVVNSPGLVIASGPMAYSNAPTPAPHFHPLQYIYHDQLQQQQQQQQTQKQQQVHKHNQGEYDKDIDGNNESTGSIMLKRFASPIPSPVTLFTPSLNDDDDVTARSDNEVNQENDMIGTPNGRLGGMAGSAPSKSNSLSSLSSSLKSDIDQCLYSCSSGSMTSSPHEPSSLNPILIASINTKTNTDTIHMGIPTPTSTCLDTTTPPSISGKSTRPGSLSINATLANRWINGIAPVTATLPLSSSTPTTTNHQHHHNTSSIHQQQYPLSPITPHVPYGGTPMNIPNANALYLPGGVPNHLITECSLMLRQMPGYRRVLVMPGDGIVVEFDTSQQTTTARDWAIHALNLAGVSDPNVLVVATTTNISEGDDSEVMMDKLTTTPANTATSTMISTIDPHVVVATHLLDLSRSATL